MKKTIFLLLILTSCEVVVERQAKETDSVKVNIGYTAIDSLPGPYVDSTNIQPGIGNFHK